MTKILSIVIIQVVVLVYNLCFYNKYYPIVEGWYSVYAEHILRGKIPYIDFHFILPPVYPYFLTAVIQVLGHDILSLRLVGILIVLLFSTFLFLIIRQVFDNVTSTIATLVAVIYYHSIVVYISYDFLQLLTLFLLISTYLIFESLHAKTKRSFIVSSFFAGVFGSLAVLTKQSNGFFVFALLSVSFAIVHLSPFFRFSSVKKIVPYILGAFIPLLLVIFWLASHGAIQAFYQQVVVDASASKGKMGTILTGWIPRTLNLSQFGSFFFLLIVLYCLGYFERVTVQPSVNDSSSPRKEYQKLLFVLIVGLLTVLVPLNRNLSSFLDSLMFDYSVSQIFYSVVIVVFVLSFALLLPGFRVAVSPPEKEKKLLILALMSIGFLLGNGTSAGISIYGAFIGLPILICILLQKTTPWNLGKLFFLPACLLLMAFCVKSKYDKPYSWWGITEPGIYDSSSEPKTPLLKGLKLNPESTKMIDEVVELIKLNSTESDEVFTFPNVPIFTLMSERLSKQFVLLHWYDILPDNLAQSEAQRILTEKPKVVVFLDLAESVLLGHELLFRSGGRIGQRDIIESIRKLSESPEYSLAGEYAIRENNTLQVWIRR